MRHQTMDKVQKHNSFKNTGIFHPLVLWGHIQKFPDWVDKWINNNNNKHSLRSNENGYSGKVH
jgi:hypothetical protein